MKLQAPSKAPDKVFRPRVHHILDSSCEKPTRRPKPANSRKVRSAPRSCRCIVAAPPPNQYVDGMTKASRGRWVYIELTRSHRKFAGGWRHGKSSARAREARICMEGGMTADAAGGSPLGQGSRRERPRAREGHSSGPDRGGRGFTISIILLLRYSCLFGDTVFSCIYPWLVCSSVEMSLAHNVFSATERSRMNGKCTVCMRNWMSQRQKNQKAMILGRELEQKPYQLES